MRNTTRILAILAFFSIHFTLLMELAKAEHSTAFRPMWRLLSAHDKKQFISGYLYALDGAEDVTEIVLEYVREHPDEALTGLEKIQNIYRASGLSADRVVAELDSLFEQAEGKEVSLSQAFAIARQRLGH